MAVILGILLVLEHTWINWFIILIVGIPIRSNFHIILLLRWLDQTSRLLRLMSYIRNACGSLMSLLNLKISFGGHLIVCYFQWWIWQGGVFTHLCNVSVVMRRKMLSICLFIVMFHNKCGTWFFFINHNYVFRKSLLRFFSTLRRVKTREWVPLAWIIWEARKSLCWSNVWPYLGRMVHVANAMLDNFHATMLHYSHILSQAGPIVGTFNSPQMNHKAD